MPPRIQIYYILDNQRRQGKKNLKYWIFFDILGAGDVCVINWYNSRI